MALNRQRSDEESYGLILTFDNIGNLLSANRISIYLKSQRLAVNVQSPSSTTSRP